MHNEIKTTAISQTEGENENGDADRSKDYNTWHTEGKHTAINKVYGTWYV